MLTHLPIAGIAGVATAITLSDGVIRSVRVPYLDDFASYSGPTLLGDVQLMLTILGWAWAILLAGLVMLVWMNCGLGLPLSWRRRLHDWRRLGWPAR